MQPELLDLGGSLAAVLALALYVHFVWDRRRAAPALDGPRALALFRAEHPEVDADDALVTEDGRAALVRDARAGTIGLVAAFGARWWTRVLDAGALVPGNDGCVRLTWREAAQSALVLRFPAGAARAWFGGDR